MEFGTLKCTSAFSSLRQSMVIFSAVKLLCLCKVLANSFPTQASCKFKFTKNLRKRKKYIAILKLPICLSGRVARLTFNRKPVNRSIFKTATDNRNVGKTETEPKTDRFRRFKTKSEIESANREFLKYEDKFKIFEKF
jgi:hypothetical protein